MALHGKGREELKHTADGSADRLPRATSKHEALELAVQAAEASMQALKLAKDPHEKAQLSSRVKRLLEEAEKIKLSPDWTAAAPSAPIAATTVPRDASVPVAVRPRALAEPRSSREVPRKEQILLLKGGFLNGFKFPPWTAPPAPNEFELQAGEGLFVDTSVLPLSEYQEDCLDDWKRPTDALPPPTWFPAEAAPNLGPTMQNSRNIDLVQDAATDCSVVASLCACVARVERGHPKISVSVMYPFNADAGCPMISKNGKYVVRMNFNGCYRKVVIDDRLPTSSTNRVIHMVDRHNPGLLWPPLLEKAYLKVRGGYDFPGSNSGTDLWILTGWIPEQVFLQSDDLELDRFWKRISNAFTYGDVLITMGTGKISSKTERELGLAGEHDYAVLDLREGDGQKLLLVKNPWCEGTSWRGKLKRSECSGSQDDVSPSYLASVDLDDDTDPVPCSRDLLNADDQLSPGTFWMDLDNVLQHFESMYLNWNPGLFKHRQDTHFSWDLSVSDLGQSYPRGRYTSLSRHPQFRVSADSGGTVWIVLCRHFQNAVPADATAEEIEADRYGVELSGHMSLLAFSSDGHRVLLPDKAIQKGWFVDSPQTLLKLDDCGPGQVVTLVLAEEELPAISHNFTMSAFSNSQITLQEATTRYMYANKMSGAWTEETAGGNAHSPTYSTNPQYSITVARKTSISLLLEAVNDELNVHVKLVHSKGQRAHSIRNRDIVFDSKDYRRGCAVAHSNELEAGQYTIICSTFEPQQLGAYALLVESTQPTQVVLLAREGAGRIRTELQTITFQPEQRKVAAPLVPRRLVRLYGIARLLGQPDPREASNQSLLRMSLEIGREPHRRVLIASGDGEFSDCVGGIRTEDVDLHPDMRRSGEIWLVLDRMCVSSEGREEKVGVDIFADQLDAITCGTWRVLDD